ncbi:hypothetical protein H6G54_01485 [Anabaena cylindrica FACHB-243]|uniref:DUF4149 domain-containing protein n=1 Tax=Anabaena cylindrica (strain ATCC 27899 / PCC 7122) TaxID=272123 RepID=K9ZNQ2_ANACC|nr:MULTISPECIES: hypothetical protein [Anabaena]AFZ60419.1 hypothetical protein Anacy_5081 [Anabaena cylindrica PCC 7122]MBD2416407.1 hypothetical protein [Anabaena cylindrica FACHB-243]MBY5308240.1 hypothetical protein [Anabaena sp. CCAP 1446/1C]MCM2408460.1 hypothetical protein [Anabaena sp. CCAP 1446/1C]BAY02506.1 hypothetical protein NIES19_17510 [Anabaena cylindrica PCC 7122]
MNAISNWEFKRSTWQTAIMLTLGFWLSATLVLDWVIMPSLYISGMMNQASFSTAGYAIFWNFNRLELLSASVVLTGVLAICKAKSNWHLNSIVLSVLLLTVALLDTYFLTPQMCAVGTSLSLFAESVVPVTMNVLHGGYFLLEVFKLVAGAMLLNWCWQEV